MEFPVPRLKTMMLPGNEMSDAVIHFYTPRRLGFLNRGPLRRNRLLFCVPHGFLFSCNGLAEMAVILISVSTGTVALTLQCGAYARLEI